MILESISGSSSGASAGPCGACAEASGSASGACASPCGASASRSEASASPSGASVDGQIPCMQPPIVQVVNSKKGNVGILDRTSWLERAKSALRLSSLEDDHDRARILCYTNRIVDNLVPHARRAIHGEMADQYQVLPGEVLISRKAVMANASLNEDELGEEPDILISSNREMVRRCYSR